MLGCPLIGPDIDLKRLLSPFRALSALSLCLALGAMPAFAFDSLSIRLEGAQNDALQKRLRASSLLRMAQEDGVSDAQDVFSTALADYQRLLETLYAQGYYSGVIHIRLDGREAAAIPPLDAPDRIGKIEVTVAPGKQFRFGRASVAPLAPGSTLPEGFAPGQPAHSTAVIEAAQAAVDGWRLAGHAKAQPTTQHLTANHVRQILDAEIGIAPGPEVTFGTVQVAGASKVRPNRIRRIAGLPVGERYSPLQMEKAANRLRRTGAFRSVTLSEAEQLNPDNSMDVTATVVDEKPRRFGAGAELSNYEGLTLSGFWMHRNLQGRAERLRLDAKVAGIGGDTGGIDYTMSARFERPAVFGADTKGYAYLTLESLDEVDYRSDNITLGIGTTRIFTDHLEGDVEIALSHFETNDAYGKRYFTLLSLPTALRWDHRDSILNPTRGHYVNAQMTPFVGLAGETAGAQLKLDSRVYRSLGGDGRFVAAGRFQMGSVMGPELSETAPDFLFYSGGGGTVRGQPYQSLNVDLGGGNATGGRTFVGVSGELRAKISGAFSVVGFADAGYIGAESLYDGSGSWHSGAGLGLRYDTVVGPVRLDVAGPLGGDTGDGVQVYIGIGQAF